MRLAALFGAAILLAAASQHITAFTGTWKLNLAKSQFRGEAPFQRFTITFAEDGTRHLDLVPADGQPTKITLPWSDGKEVSPEGIEKTVATSKIQGRTFHDVWKQNGKLIEEVRGVLLHDGNRLQVTVHGITGQGHAYHNDLTFDRQQQ